MESVHREINKSNVLMFVLVGMYGDDTKLYQRQNQIRPEQRTLENTMWIERKSNFSQIHEIAFVNIIAWITSNSRGCYEVRFKSACVCKIRERVNFLLKFIDFHLLRTRVVNDSALLRFCMKLCVYILSVLNGLASSYCYHVIITIYYVHMLYLHIVMVWLYSSSSYM